MSFWEKIKSSLRRFMVGRNGPDELSFAILIFALVLLLVSSFFASWVLNLLDVYKRQHCAPCRATSCRA